MTGRPCRVYAVGGDRGRRGRVREYVLVFLVSAAVTFLVTPLTRRFAVRTGAMASPRDRDVHVIPTPRLGGLAMYAGLAAGLLVAGAAALPVLGLPRLRRAARRPGRRRRSSACSAPIDDKWPIDALTKLAGQVAAASVMVLLGVQLSFAILPNGNTASLGPETAVPLTMLLTVVLVNAMNFVDGLDGLAAGVAAIAALAGFAYSYHISVTNGMYRATPATLLAVATAGVLRRLPAAQLQSRAPVHGRLRARC